MTMAVPEDNLPERLTDKQDIQRHTEALKAQIDGFLEVREYLRSRIADLLIPDVDYYEIKGKKSLSKSGAEKLAAIMQFRGSFRVDRDSMEALGCYGDADKGAIFYVCTLVNKHGEEVGEGRGADWIERNQNDPNKTVKMAQKKSHVDAVIRACGLSDIFTQDMGDEDKPEPPVKPVPTWTPRAPDVRDYRKSSKPKAVEVAKDERFHIPPYLHQELNDLFKRFPPKPDGTSADDVVAMMAFLNSCEQNGWQRYKGREEETIKSQMQKLKQRLIDLKIADIGHNDLPF